MIGIIIGGVVVLIILIDGIKIIRPTQRGAVETLGKYTRFGKDGFNWIIPIIQKMTDSQQIKIWGFSRGYLRVGLTSM